MPQVPTYESVAEQKPLPGIQQESVATPGLLGGAADSQAAAAKGLETAGTGGVAIGVYMQDKEDADKVFQVETKWKGDYLAYQADINQNRKGDFSKGVTSDTQKWWDDNAKQHLEALDNDRQRKLLIKRMSPVRLNSVESVSKFEAQQRDISLDQSAIASKVASTDLAAANADEVTVRMSVADIKKTNAFIAARKGLTDPVVLEKMNDEDITNLHKQVIQTLVKKNPNDAKGYFDLHKDEIRGSLRAEIGEFAQKATSEALGVEGAGAEWKASGPKTDKDPVNLDVMEQNLRDKYKDDTFTLKAAISNLRERSQAFNTGRKEREDKIESTVNEAVLKGASISQVRAMPEFFQMAPDKARAISTYMENISYTRSARADAEENRADRRLTKDGRELTLRLADPDELVKMTRNSLMTLLPVVGAENLTALVQRHDQLTKSADALSAARIDNDTFKSLAINAGLHPDKKGLSEEDKDRLVQLRAAVDARLLLANRTAGKPLPPDQRAKIAQQAFDDTVRLPGFFSISGYGTGTDLPVSSLTKAERDKAVVVLDTGRVRVRDIPPAFVDEAETTLRNNSRAVNQKSVAQMWLLNKTTWKPKGKE